MTKVFNSSLIILILAGSQPHIPIIIATPIIEKSTSAKILSLLLKMNSTLSLRTILRIMIMVAPRH